MDSRISQLIYRAITGCISESEKDELRTYIHDEPMLDNLVAQLINTDFLKKEYDTRQIIDILRPYSDMQRRIDSIRNRNRRRRVIIAAAVIAVLAINGWWFANISQQHTLDTVSYQAALNIDSIKPGRPLAMLSSDEWEQISLSAKESGKGVSELYPTQNKTPETAEKPEELCLEVPRGGEFKVVLEDSTEVWLNSESTLRYPSKFSDDERRVEVSGEVYLSVKKDVNRPFYVVSAGQEVRVYGTTFNIKAYPDEDFTYTTLETGTISLRKSEEGSGELYLHPGHQAVFDKKGSSVEMKQVDTQIVTGWRHGRFVLEEQSLGNIMRDLSRWYNFRYEFTDSQLEQLEFMGSIPRYADFKTALSILEKSGGITFTISGEHVLISKKPE